MRNASVNEISISQVFRRTRYKTRNRDETDEEQTLRHIINQRDFFLFFHQGEIMKTVMIVGLFIGRSA